MVDKEQLMKILELNYIKGRSYVDIAEQLGITRQTVSKICKAYEQYREEYPQYYYTNRDDFFVMKHPWVRNGENNRVIKAKKEDDPAEAIDVKAIMTEIVDEELEFYHPKRQYLSELIDKVISRAEDEHNLTFSETTIRRFIEDRMSGRLFPKIAD